MPKASITLCSDAIAPLVHWIRHEKVILDFDLAALYGVETRALKQAVRCNRDRFPSDFMFALSTLEMRMLVSQSVIPRLQKFGGAAPYAFTEQDVAMLSSVLLPAGQEHVLAAAAKEPKPEEHKQKFLSAVSDLSKAFALAVPHEKLSRPPSRVAVRSTRAQRPDFQEEL